MGDRMIGTVLGAYFIERKLGEGGMGAVYAGRHVRTGRAYAIKVLLPDRVAHSPPLSRFRREAEALGAIGHAHIVAIHDFDQTPDGTWFLAMDLLEGEDLGARLARTGALRWQDAIAIVDPIASALAAAHRIGLIHRDIKPSNVFLAQLAGIGGERPMLLDFGLARAVDDPAAEQAKLTASGVVIGTPTYMSPEQAQGFPLDGRTDVWSLGILLFEACAGRTPFEGPTIASTLAAVLTPPRPRLATLGVDVPPALEAVLDRALAKAPEHRYANADAFRAALAEIAGTGGPRSIPPTQEARVLRPEPRSSSGALKWLLVAFGALVVLGLLLTIGAGAIAFLATRSDEVEVAQVSEPSSIAREPQPREVVQVADVEAPPEEAAGEANETPVESVETDEAPEETAMREVAPESAREARVTMRSEPPLERVERVEMAEPAQSDVASGPPAEPPIGSGPPPALVRATERMGVGDFPGCLRELESAGTSAPVLGARMNCALRTGRRSDLERACALLRQHQPSHGYTRTCEQLLAVQ
jgi:serine/threonine-protein kinase